MKVEIFMERPINTLQMNVLPKFLILNVVAFAPPIFVFELKSMFCNFTWNNSCLTYLFFISLMIEEA